MVEKRVTRSETQFRLGSARSLRLFRGERKGKAFRSRLFRYFQSVSFSTEKHIANPVEMHLYRLSIPFYTFDDNSNNDDLSCCYIEDRIGEDEEVVDSIMRKKENGSMVALTCMLVHRRSRKTGRYHRSCKSLQLSGTAAPASARPPSLQQNRRKKDIHQRSSAKFGQILPSFP